MRSLASSPLSKQISATEIDANILASKAEMIETLKIVFGKSTALDEILHGTSVSASAVDENTSGLMSNRSAPSEMIGFVFQTLSSALQSELLASPKRQSITAAEILGELAIGGIGGGEFSIGASNNLALMELNAGIRASSDAKSETASSLSGRTDAIIELASSLIASAKAVVESGLSLFGHANGLSELLNIATSHMVADAESLSNLVGKTILSEESLRGMAANISIKGESVLGLAIHGVALAELIGLTITTFNNITQLELASSNAVGGRLAAEAGTSLLSRSDALSELIRGTLTHGSAQSELLSSASAHGVATDELLGVTLYYFNSIALLETVSSAKATLSAEAEKISAILASRSDSIETIGSELRRISGLIETITKGNSEFITAAEIGGTIVALTAASALAFEIAGATKRVIPAESELLATRQFYDLQHTELSALATRRVADAIELASGLRAQISAAHEMLLSARMQSQISIEEIGVIFAFLNSSAALIELIATRLSAISRASSKPLVIAIAADAPASIASSEDQP